METLSLTPENGSFEITDRHPDGERFLRFRRPTAEAAEGETPYRLVVVTNWLPELERRLAEAEQH